MSLDLLIYCLFWQDFSQLKWRTRISFLTKKKLVPAEIRIILKLVVELSRLRSVRNACFLDINIVLNEIIIFLTLKSGRKGMGHWTASYIGT